MQMKNHLLAVSAVVAGAGFLTLGIVARDWADTGQATVAIEAEPNFTGLLASTEKRPGEGKEIPETVYFNQIAELLKDNYVDPIKDEVKLATGAARGMVMGLDDPNSLYYNVDQFKAFQERQKGTYAGIGADFILVISPRNKDAKVASIPKLVVSEIAPDGPAAKAGMKVGDEIDTIDGHWILNSVTLEQFQKLQQAALKDPSKTEALRAARKDLRVKTEKAILPFRGYERLTTGTGSSVDVIYRRGTSLFPVSLVKSVSNIKPVDLQEGVYRVNVQTGIGEAMKSIPTSGSVTLDLRNNANRNMALLPQMFSAVAPEGAYGLIVPARPKSKPIEISTKTGVKAEGRKLTLIVDESTRGVAAAFAAALKAKNLASVSGMSETTKVLCEVVQLPDGTGYTLARGNFQAGAIK